MRGRWALVTDAHGGLRPVGHALLAPLGRGKKTPLKPYSTGIGRYILGGTRDTPTIHPQMHPRTYRVTGP
jgi:hypothetical protein